MIIMNSRRSRSQHPGEKSCNIDGGRTMALLTRAMQRESYAILIGDVQWHWKIVQYRGKVVQWQMEDVQCRLLNNQVGRLEVGLYGKIEKRQD